MLGDKFSVLYCLGIRKALLSQIITFQFKHTKQFMQSFSFLLFRLKKNDDGAAKVGVVEATTEPTEYQHPRNEKIIFVDLPGIGTPGYPDLETYCKKVDLEKYDTFLIFSATRFTQNDLVLAKKVKSIGKSFFFIRTKIDVDCTPHNGETINEEEILEQIRNNCMIYVKGLISSERNIFLISNYHKDKWDFDRLIEAISDALPVIQRECLTLSLSNVTRECLKRKVKIFKGMKGLTLLKIISCFHNYNSEKPNKKSKYRLSLSITVTAVISKLLKQFN
jgi:hypothetical protein